jgi:hypothetical protein
VLGSSIIWKANTEAIVVAVGSGVLPSDVTDIAGAVRAELAAQLAKVDALVVTSGRVEADIKAVNGYAVTGNGQTGTEWGPA